MALVLRTGATPPERVTSQPCCRSREGWGIHHEPPGWTRPSARAPRTEQEPPRVLAGVFAVVIALTGMPVAASASTTSGDPIILNETH